jgi:two-component system response regulator AtoC
MIRSGIKQIAVSDVPVVIRGESGVGKEVLAREIHAESARANKPFMKINCAAVPQELLESELFGYERGAFTGAMKSTPGKFEVADGGTILLDEIGDMDFKLQAKLLHVLQDSEFQRLGGPDIVRVNVRVLAATHCDLEQAILAKRFREDLYYRLNVITIELPPLRERRDEIIRLAEFFLQKHAVAGMPVPTISASLAQSLLEHAWPGNIRELENVMRKFLVFRDAEALAEELRGKARIFAHPPATLPAVNAGDTVPLSALDAVDEARKRDEANAIVQALDATHWNRKRAAALLCVDYKVLLYRMKKLGIGPSESAANQDRTEDGDIRPPSTERVHYAGA